MQTETNTAAQPIAFILDNVDGFDAMAASLAAGYEVHVLDSSGDALAQMAAILDGRSGIEAVHLISHGQAGVLDMGSLSLSLANMGENSAHLATIGSALSADADFLIYGCDVAAGDTGQAFVAALAQATGADVAASVDTTGPLSLGGDADLESHTGSIEAASIDAGLFQTNLSIPSEEVSLTEVDNGTGVTVVGSLSGTLTAVGMNGTITYGVNGGVSGENASDVSLAGLYGTFYLDADSGAYFYVADMARVEALNVGPSVTDVYTWTATDSVGAVSSNTFTVTLTGANDAPVITLSAPSAALVEDGGVRNETLGVATSVITVDKLDIDGTANWDTSWMATQGWVLAIDGLSMLNEGTYGSASMVLSSGVVTYSLNNASAATQLLTGGQAVVETFNLRVDDGAATTNAVATFSITGTDDDVAVVASLVEAAILEDGASNGWTGGAVLNGTLAVVDEDSALPDLSGLQYTVDGAATLDENGNLVVTAQAGTLELDVNTGAYRYLPSTTAINALSEGQVVVDTFNFSVTGVAGPVASGSFSVTVTGSNDAPVLVLEAPTSTLVEAGGVSNGLSGVQASQVGVLMSDPEGVVNIDVSAMVTGGWALSTGLTSLVMDGLYGSAELFLASGVMVYTLDNASVATQSLIGGASVTESFDAHIIDGFGVTAQSSAVFSITGTDDSPDLGVVEAPYAATYIDGNGQEQTNYNRTGMLSISDVDTDINSYGVVSYDGTNSSLDDGGIAMMTGYFGNLYINTSTGQFDFVGNVGAIQGLAEGQLGQEVFDLNMSDVNGVIGNNVYQVQFIGVAPPVEV